MSGEQNLLEQVRAVQAAHPGWNFERAFDQTMRERENPPGEPKSISEAAQIIKEQRPTLTFAECWNFAEDVYPDLVKSSTAGSNRVPAKPFHQVEAAARLLMTESGGRMTMGEALRRARGDDVVEGSTAKPLTTDPRITEQMRKIKALEDDKTSAGIERHAKFLNEVRKLTSRDTSITSAEAINRVIREHPELWSGTKEQIASARHAGSLLFVTAQSVALSGTVPNEIMYMPQGRTVLTPSVNGEAKTISVNVTRATADLLQGDLERLLKQNVPPIICFDHAEKRAAAIPKKFTWKEGKGVFLTVDWTSSGQAAVAGHDYGWLSPTFMMSGDGEPVGLPKSGGSIGSLTNRPAFTSIARIAAPTAGVANGCN